MMKINYLYNDNSTCSHVGIVYTFNIEKNDLPAIFLLANLLEKKEIVIIILKNFIEF